MKAEKINDISITKPRKLYHTYSSSNLVRIYNNGQVAAKDELYRRHHGYISSWAKMKSKHNSSNLVAYVFLLMSRSPLPVESSEKAFREFLNGLMNKAIEFYNQ